MRMKKNIYLFLAFSLCSSATVFAQNIIKFNLSSVALKHYSLQYERITGPRQSFAVGFGVSPNVGLPFKNTLLDQYSDNEDARKAIESTVFNKITITPEYRFYLGKNGSPRGLYVAPFARYSNMTIDQNYTFTPSSGIEHTAHLKGKFNGIGGGVMLGAQWALSGRVTLDWFIVGPFFGKTNASFHGTDDMSDMSAQDKADLENDIESVEIPMWEIDATVGNNQIDAELKGPFYGVRAFGISLGFMF